MSLTEKEKTYEKPLEDLRNLSINRLDLKNTDKTLESLERIIREWDTLLNSNILSRAFNEIIKSINTAKSSGDSELQIKNLRILDFVLAPLEYYMIGLEEMKARSFRNVVTRCGMVCERIVNRLLFELNAKDLLEVNSKFNDKVGWMQSELSKKKVAFASDFCNRLSGIYNIRNRRGPHDVPCADEIEAKDCIASMPLCYSRYLNILELLGYDLGQVKGNLTGFVNEIVTLGTLLPTVGKGGRKPRIVDILTDIYRQGFFSTPKALPDVRSRLKELGYDFRRSSIANSLNVLSRRGILRKLGTRGNFKYSQKIPPTVYFE